VTNESNVTDGVCGIGNNDPVTESNPGSDPAAEDPSDRAESHSSPAGGRRPARDAFLLVAILGLVAVLVGVLAVTRDQRDAGPTASPRSLGPTSVPTPGSASSPTAPASSPTSPARPAPS